MEPLHPRFNPFPGLRPFDTRDKYLFFGREAQTTELLTRLRLTRFLSVIGTSGSGKSSLVRAGLIPGLHTGFLAGAGPNWRVAVTRPGGDPVGNLAFALDQLDLMDVEEDPQAFIRATLARSAFGLIEFVQQSRLRPGYNLLIVVDQFEEVFRFRSRYRTLEEEAGGFVRLLVEAAAQKERPIYVALTMRSDFLGDCAEFAGLAEAINEGEYLIPRMKRDQYRMAIEGPARVGGGQVAGRLVQRLLNDMGSDPDQLPVLQHALMRTWDFWVRDRQGDEPLDLRHYEAVGGMAEALSRHADEVYDELTTERDRQLASGLCKALTEMGSDNRGIRRPTRLGKLSEILAAEPEELRRVVDRFRQPGRTFLMPPMTLAGDDEDEAAAEDDGEARSAAAQRASRLEENTVIDISHESLMRLWRRLEAWVRQEADSAAIYRRLADSARLRGLGRFDLYRDPELQLALNWRHDNAPNSAWGERYAAGFDQAMSLLDASRDAREAARREVRRRRQALFAAISVVAVLFFVLWLYAERQQRRATSNWLAIRARESVGVDPRESVLLARAAVRSAPTRDAVAALRGAVWESRLVRDELGGTSGPPAEAALDPRKQRILIAVGSQAAVCSLASPAEPSRVLTGHLAEVRAAGFSPDGRVALTAGWDYRGILWDTANWTQRAALIGHASNIARARFDGSGSNVITASADGTARIWQVATGKERARLMPREGTEVWSGGFSEQGDQVVLGTDSGEVSVWDWAANECLWRAQHSPTGRVLDVRFSPGDKVLASAGDDGRVVLWNGTGSNWWRRAELAVSRDHVNMVAFSTAGRLLATASDDGSARIWEWTSATPLFSLRHHGSVKSVAFDADGRHLLTTSTQGGARLWSTDLRELPPEADWSRRSSTNSATRVQWAVFAPDGDHLVLGEGSSNAVVVDYPAGRRVAELKGHAGVVSYAAFHPRGHLLATCAADRRVRIWDPRGGSLVTEITFSNTSPSPRWAAFSPDGKWLAVTRRRSLTVLETAGWRTIVDTNLHEGDITGLSFSADSSFLATSGRDNQVRILRTGSWGPDLVPALSHEKFVNHVAFHPKDPTLMATASDAVRFYGRRDQRWELLRVPAGGPTNGVGWIAFCPPGDAMVSVDWEGRIQLWDTTTRGLIGRVPSQRPSTNAPTFPGLLAIFTPDGRQLLSLDPLGLVHENAAWRPLQDLESEVDRRWRSTRPREDGDGH